MTTQVCPGCGSPDVRPGRVYCKPVCQAAHQYRLGQREPRLPRLTQLVTELPTGGQTRQLPIPPSGERGGDAHVLAKSETKKSNAVRREYTVVWSASKYRNGTAAGLSSMRPQRRRRVNHSTPPLEETNNG
jgi:hypothetical protein